MWVCSRVFVCVCTDGKCVCCMARANFQKTNWWIYYVICVWLRYGYGLSLHFRNVKYGIRIIGIWVHRHSHGERFTYSSIYSVPSHSCMLSKHIIRVLSIWRHEFHSFHTIIIIIVSDICESMPQPMQGTKGPGPRYTELCGSDDVWIWWTVRWAKRHGSSLALLHED